MYCPDVSSVRNVLNIHPSVCLLPLHVGSAVTNHSTKLSFFQSGSKCQKTLAPRRTLSSHHQLDEVCLSLVSNLRLCSEPSLRDPSHKYANAKHKHLNSGHYLVIQLAEAKNKRAIGYWGLKHPSLDGWT